MITQGVLDRTVTDQSLEARRSAELIRETFVRQTPRPHYWLSFDRSDPQQFGPHLSVGRAFIRHLVKKARSNFAILADDVCDRIRNSRGSKGIRLVIKWLFGGIVDAIRVYRLVLRVAEQSDVERAWIIRLIRVVNHLARVIMRIHADRQNLNVFLFFG